MTPTDAAARGWRELSTVAAARMARATAIRREAGPLRDAARREAPSVPGGAIRTPGGGPEDSLTYFDIYPCVLSSLYVTVRIWERGEREA